MDAEAAKGAVVVASVVAIVIGLLGLGLINLLKKFFRIPARDLKGLEKSIGIVILVVFLLVFVVRFLQLVGGTS